MQFEKLKKAKYTLYFRWIYEPSGNKSRNAPPFRFYLTIIGIIMPRLRTKGQFKHSKSSIRTIHYGRTG